MQNGVDLVEVWRGDVAESRHQGAAVVMREGRIEAAWGDPQAVILPRSSVKMIQALPLVESGAAAAHGVSDAELALACASHTGAGVHTERVAAWLRRIGCDDGDLRCGAHLPGDRDARQVMIRAGAAPAQIHNSCSGKHAGFLTLARHLGGGPEYVALDHPVQRAVRARFEEMTGQPSPGLGIDGCSAPNFATTLEGLARAMCRFAMAPEDSAAARLTRAMIAHPDLIAGEGQACTRLIRACEGRAAVKFGAEGVYVAILPDRATGIAVKIADGALRAAEAVIAALLIRCGVLDPSHPVERELTQAPQRNWRGIITGHIRVTPDLLR